MTSFSSEPWDGSPSNWPDTNSYCASCAIDMNEPGQPKVQALCKLPYKFPNGKVSTASLNTCTNVLMGSMGGVKGVPDAVKRKAAKLLVGLMKEAKMPISDGKYRMAGMEPPSKS